MKRQSKPKKVAFGSRGSFEGMEIDAGRGKSKTTMFTQTVEGLISDARKKGRY
jgi:hypothetical protein